MSRIGKTPIALPSGVEVSVSGSTVEVKGPKGALSHNIPEAVATWHMQNGHIRDNGRYSQQFFVAYR